MATALDVAKYILKKHGSMTAMKLQKLVYYSQAWALVWDEEPLFHERIEAWANGPVVPSLFQKHRGQFRVDVDSLPEANSKALEKYQRETVDVVLGFYGNKSSQWLSDQTHKESPWAEARKGMKAGERGSREITHRAMADYYESLTEDEPDE